MSKLKFVFAQDPDWQSHSLAKLLRQRTNPLKPVEDHEGLGSVDFTAIPATRHGQDDPNRTIMMKANVESSALFVSDSKTIFYHSKFNVDLGAPPTKAQYQVRLTELMLDAADDETPLQMSATVDFLRHLKESSLMAEMPRGMMGATPSGGITVAWRRSGRRLSVTFLGDEKAMVVRLSPGDRAKATLVDRNSVEEIVSGCKWIASKPLITSSHT